MILLIKLHHQVKESFAIERRNRTIRFLDEHALVTAMKEMGVIFFRRTPDSAVISFVKQIFLFDEVLSDDFHFREARKRNMRF